MGDKTISTGNSVPSARRPLSLTSVPVGRVLGAGLLACRCAGCTCRADPGTQRLQGCADEVVVLIAEHRFRLVIEEPDHPGRVHPHQGIRDRLQQAFEPHRLRGHLVSLRVLAKLEKLAANSELLPRTLRRNLLPRQGCIILVPPAGFEPALPPPEGGALSPELRGPMATVVDILFVVWRVAEVSSLGC